MTKKKKKSPDPDQLTEEQLDEVYGGGGAVDTCMAPSGGFAPVPMPAVSSSSSSGSTNIPATSGDESGTLGGVVSGTLGGGSVPNTYGVTFQGRAVKIRSTG